METGVPSLDKVFDLFSAYQRTAALKAAIELDVFTAIGEGADRPAALATRCQASERGLRILCDALVVMGLLTKTAGRYGLTVEAELFLDRRSRGYVGSVIHFISAPTIVEGFNRLTAAVRQGGTAVQENALAPDHPVWVEFARAMAPLARMMAEMVAGLLSADTGPRWKILDLAAGHGLYGITLARCNPNAQVVAQDWANVLAVAEENARTAGIAERFRTLPGSAFTVPFGTDYDLVLLTNFLHHFDVATCETLLRKVHAALAPSGRAVVVEMVPNPDRVTPPLAAFFSLVMLAGTPAGDAYTFAEYEQMFRHAGFARAELCELVPSPQQVVIGYR